VAEAEDIITDVARHATVYAQALWQRHRASSPPPRTVALADVARRLDLLIAAVFGTTYRIRTAQAPAPTTFLTKAFRRRERPRAKCAIPATDGVSIWLPFDAGIADPAAAMDRFRTVAMQQAMRASRGSAALINVQAIPLVRDVYLLIEADAADEALARQLPGMAGSLNALRRAALAARPSMASFPVERQPLELFAQTMLQRECGYPNRGVYRPASPEESERVARRLAAEIVPDAGTARLLGAHPLFKDWWTGEFRSQTPLARDVVADYDPTANHETSAEPRSGRLPRRPDVRDSSDEENDVRQGAWMIQSSQPQEHAEDPFGMQRPTDRDDQTAAEEFADSFSDLAEARLVWTPGRPKEVLLSNDPPDTRARRSPQRPDERASSISYPEWDYRINAYREPGATIRMLPPESGPQQWIDHTLTEHRSMLDAIRRRFEMLHAQRTRLRKQLDGDELDLEMYIDSQADFRAGLPMAQALYQTQRRSRRNMAIMLLIDISGSTDAWISANRRVIDVEREALLLVCIALEGMGEPYSVQAFSGQGAHAVTVRTIKQFDERYTNDIARRIAALQPEQYTRAGAAIRHASTTLMRELASHRLLLLLSDGKPNDVDRYESQYGVEDTRQAVTEAKLQGIFPFCLTVDRQAADYLPGVFGARQYALLQKPELLPIVLLDWMKRLVVA
jgi:nitric oxide reductase NorD protein